MFFYFCHIMTTFNKLKIKSERHTSTDMFEMVTDKLEIGSDYIGNTRKCQIFFVTRIC